MRLAPLPTALLLGFLPVAAHANEAACRALVEMSGQPPDLEITVARHVPERDTPPQPAQAQAQATQAQPRPPHCHVEGRFERRTGSDGRDYEIRFAINMPDDWNGRFLFQGGGGLNGTLQEPIGAQYVGPRSALEQGFAVVSTDSGHAGAVFDASFKADQQALLNFEHQANAKVTAAARPIVEHYYGEPPHHSYFLGCSTGGREGMIMAQRYPRLFDGIVSGAPAMQTGVSNLALRWIGVELGRATDPRDPFTPIEEALIMGSLLESCDALDGLEDGLIFNRAACDFDPRMLACSVASGETCLADAKAEALSRALSGPVNAAGLPVYVPFPYDSGLDDPGGLPGLLLGGANPPEGRHGADMDEQNVDAEYMFAMSADQSLGNTATQYNVSTFIHEGGKHIFFHGEADPWFSSNDTVRYVERMADANAGVAPVGDYARLYLVPGMAHCSGGERTPDRFDMLTPLVDWVETGGAPEAIVATGSSMNGESRKLCPWPTYAHYVGDDAASAESFVCQ